MLKALRAVARFLQNTIGWNRIGVLLSIAIIGIPGVVLVRMLRGVDVHDVLISLRATSGHHIAPGPGCRSRPCGC